MNTVLKAMEKYEKGKKWKNVEINSEDFYEPFANPVKARRILSEMFQTNRIWQTADKCVIPYQFMMDSHLLNSFNLVVKRLPSLVISKEKFLASYQVMAELSQELDKRGISYSTPDEIHLIRQSFMSLPPKRTYTHEEQMEYNNRWWDKDSMKGDGDWDDEDALMHMTIAEWGDK